MGFRKFLISFIALVTIPIILLFLCFIGMGFEILQFFSTLVVYVLIMIFGFIVAFKLGAKVTKANPEEIRREDEVLLQAVAFSQSVLFILVNQTPIEDKLQWSLLIAIVAVTFYALRAWAKIKDSPKYRYYSMLAFSFITSNTVTSLLGLYFNIPQKSILNMTNIYTSIALAFAIIAASVFGKRYGYKGFLSYPLSFSEILEEVIKKEKAKAQKGKRICFLALL